MLPIKDDDTRRFFVFLPAEKAYEVVANSKNMLRPEEIEEDEDEEEGGGMMESILYSKMPKEEACKDALPLCKGTYVAGRPL